MQARFKLAIPEGSSAVEEVNKHRSLVDELLTRIKMADVVVLPPNGIVVQRQSAPRQPGSVAAIIAAPAPLPAVEGELPEVELYLEYNGSVADQDLIAILTGGLIELGEPAFYQPDDQRLAWNESMLDYVSAGKAQLVELVQFVTNDLHSQGYIHSPIGQAAYKLLPEGAKAAVDKSIELQNQAGELLNNIDLHEGEVQAPELEAANTDETQAEGEQATDPVTSEANGERASGAPEVAQVEEV